MYLRFVFAEPERKSRRRIGIVQKAYSICRNAEEIDALYSWLNAHLPLPPKAAFSGDRALCWFKTGARECIERVRDLAFLLEKRGKRVWQIYSRNPGLITYEDEFQVVAVPESAIRRYG